MGNQCGTLLKLTSEYRFFEDEKFSRCFFRNVRDFLFPLFKPRKIQTICVLSDFEKITMFLAKIWFHRIL